MDYSRYGFVRVAAAAPPLALGNPEENALVIAASSAALDADGAALIVFPELGVTGYSCEDLFHGDDLLRRASAALASILTSTRSLDATIVVGAPWRLDDGRLLNCAFALRGGRVLGAVPKRAHPNYDEFYEQRWFTSGFDETVDISDEALGSWRLGSRQLFALGPTQFGIELCEDLWGPAPPSVEHALAGAEIVVNLSASNELVAKADYRRDLVRMQSARLFAAYVYASSGPLESSKDVVYGGHLIVAENGRVLAESDRFALDGESLATDLDWRRLRHERTHNTTFAGAPRPPRYDVVGTRGTRALESLSRSYPRHPFVPDDENEFDAHATEILAIQTTGLARRVRAARAERLVIGLSGGLDSSLAFLVCLDAAAKLDRPPTMVHAVTLPGPGTSDHTLQTARELARIAGAGFAEIPIHAAVTQHLKDIGHEGGYDVTFENSQARERTQILFNTANRIDGIVVGTGDMSELALGWCTFNADHMANYNVNAAVPKTMMAYLVRWYAKHRAGADLGAVLERVLDTPITPELVPADDGGIGQHTEAIVGPYELHDFFLYHVLRTGADPEKIYALARLAFDGDYRDAELKEWLASFFLRFHQNQFKRTTLPPGPKVGTVSLSPRGDWRMPDEVDASALLRRIEALPEAPET